MTPYHHYPRVGLQYCRCDHCHNDLRSRLVSRVLDKRFKNVPHKPLPAYKRKRMLTRVVGRPLLKHRAKFKPPYKQRRESSILMQKLFIWK
jgi:hypothetical protein